MITNEPKVTLLNFTPYPKETVYSVWEMSKTEDPIRTPEQIWASVDPDKVDELFRAVIAQRIPIGEHVDFVFVLENVSVSWREQAVRHRIGTKASPERVGADITMDILPDLADSSWWSQSMRIQDMGSFATKRQYRLPETVQERGEEFVKAFHEAMEGIQFMYNELVAAGVPMEDARELIPLGAQHRLSWKLNMSALQHILGKRGCWILQLGIWGPVIMGMVEELVKKVDPMFAELVTPPCISVKTNGEDEFTGCKFHEECRRRYTGDDQLPPCPLHLAQHHDGNPDRVRLKVLAEDYRITHPETNEPVELPRAAEMVERAADYAKFWRRDPYTGEKIK